MTGGGGGGGGGGGPARHALVVTVVHHPLDARIHARQIGALLDAGWRVTYLAPWTGYGVVPPDHPRLVPLDVTRARGRDRLRAVLHARRLLRRVGAGADLVLLHDPDLLLAVPGLDLPPVVWDVHEDTAGALADRPWVPAAARPPLEAAVRSAERWAERHLHLVLAEEGYRDRFGRPHPVVPNHPPVPDRDPPPPGDDRVVYVGRISRGRGAETLVEVARRLAGEVEVELVGPVDRDVEGLVRGAPVTWHGFLPNAEALRRVEGALAGLSLLRDEPNYRHSLPTKVVEYLGRGVPAVTTPLPAARAMVDRYDAGVVVPFDDPDAVVDAIRGLRADPDGRAAMGRRGRDGVRAHHSWDADGPRFVSLLEGWAR